MKKEKIFSKFNISTFNNELEEVLDVKPFSENVKNNILNMIYKIEESYNDYNMVKIEVQTQKEFLEKILESIKNYCNSIEISNSAEMKERKYKIDNKNGNIKVNSEYSWLLYSILAILKKEKVYKNELDMTKNKPIYDFLMLGYNINNIEVIRDFNAWSWRSSKEEMESINANLIYQNLQILLGNKIMENIMQNLIIEENNLIDMLEKNLSKLHKKEISKKIVGILKKIAIVEVANKDKKYKKVLEEIRHRKQEEFKLMENKQEYLKEITYVKKTNIEIIKGIDKTINNRELLQVEYKLRNSMLKNNDKIFSISYLVDILKVERKEALEKINEINKLMEPSTYLNKKSEIKEAIDEMELDDKVVYENIVEMQKLFIKCLLNKINNINEKSEIIKMLCRVRYYINVLYNSNISINEDKSLEKDLDTLKQRIIEKVLEYKLVYRFVDDEIIKKILLFILETKIINLQTIYIRLVQNESELQVEIYDEENDLDTVKKIELKNSIKINLKADKKVKLFV